MPFPFAGKLKFFVYIVESPSAPDLYHKRSESDLLQKVLELEGIPVVARIAISRQAFYAALTLGVSNEMRSFEQRIPILHISAHGDQRGIQLSSGELVTWAELRALLQPTNKALDGRLVVTMSCCEGYSGIRMAMSTDASDEHPYGAIVGTAESPTWSDAAIAYATFYHLIGKGASLSDAVEAMRTASGDTSFFCSTAVEIKKGYIEYIQSLSAADVQNELAAAADEAQQTQKEELAKGVELEKGGAA